MNCSTSDATNHRRGNGHSSSSPLKPTEPLWQRCHVDLLKSVRHGAVVPDVPPAGCDAPPAATDPVRVQWDELHCAVELRAAVELRQEIGGV